MKNIVLLVVIVILVLTGALFSMNKSKKSVVYPGTTVSITPSLAPSVDDNIDLQDDKSLDQITLQDSANESDLNIQ